MYNGQEVGDLSEVPEGIYILSREPIRQSPFPEHIETQRGESIVGSSFLEERISNLDEAGAQEIHVLGPVRIIGENQ